MNILEFIKFPLLYWGLFSHHSSIYVICGNGNDLGKMQKRQIIYSDCRCLMCGTAFGFCVLGELTELQMFYKICNEKK
jgi:hypothetical protein